jgi:Alpha/beta hydrolase domain
MRIFPSAVAILLALGMPVSAELTRIDVASRTDVVSGKEFGAGGHYEKIVGKAVFAVDLDNPANRAIVDLDKAPRNASGQVTFSADFYALVPKDAARANGAALIEILNRGRKGAIRNFNRAPAVSDPTAEADFGDGFLMRRGFTVLWLGWQFDIPHSGGLMGLDAPAVTDRGRTVIGRVTTRFVPNTTDATFSLDNLGRYADTTHYPPVDPVSPANSLTVRDDFLAPPRPIAREAWQFGRATGDRVLPDTSAIYFKGGFEPGHVYDLSYDATGDVVAGLGFAAMRDLASALKQRPVIGVPLNRVIAFGASQDGRFLREFLYEGFNAGEHGERAFDGVIAHIAGAARGGDFNARFARPNGLGFFEASLFPYRDIDSVDPASGKTDGLLTKLLSRQRPKIFYTNSSTEYWGGGRAAALTHVTLDGRADGPLPDNVRIYLFTGSQHIPGAILGGPGQQQPNPNDFSFGLRALLSAMDRWVRDDVPPPESRYPHFADHSLVRQQDIEFPALAGVRSPRTIPGGYRADLGTPPAAPALPFLVPQVDGDGNEMAGIALPDVAVPLATYAGWNFRNPSTGAPDNLLPLMGSYIPFPLTRVARERDHDPRLSIEERYGSRGRYQALVTDRAAKLASEGYLLREDIETVVARALAHWDALAKGTPLADAR